MDERVLITFERGDRRFNLRAVAVILDKEQRRVVIHHASHEDFRGLPGGRVELGESAADALVREMREEMGVEVEAGRLLWVVEGFVTFLERNWHEISLYFLTILPPDCPLYNQTKWSGLEEGIEDFFIPKELLGTTNNLELLFEWHDIDRLHDVSLVPRFLQDALRTLPTEVQHVVRVGD
jgi:ADP-ribose pyrophosphatase YjhB (NUDIX family)